MNSVHDKIIQNVKAWISHVTVNAMETCKAKRDALVMSRFDLD
jgi:hypothetical protein